MMISAVTVLRHMTCVLVLPMSLPIWKNPPTQNKQLYRIFVELLEMWADREEMSPMDSQNVAGNYNETGSFPTASSIHNYTETPRSSLYSYWLYGTLM